MCRRVQPFRKDMISGATETLQWRQERMLKGANKRNLWNGDKWNQADRRVRAGHWPPRESFPPGRFNSSLEKKKNCLKMVLWGKIILVLFLTSWGEPTWQHRVLHVFVWRKGWINPLGYTEELSAQAAKMRREKPNTTRMGCYKQSQPTWCSRSYIDWCNYYLWPHWWQDSYFPGIISKGLLRPVVLASAEASSCFHGLGRGGKMRSLYLYFPGHSGLSRNQVGCCCLLLPASQGWKISLRRKEGKKKGKNTLAFIC